ncbi:MAG TPA: hypothetical protein VK814_17210 [Acidobacteriaceae bacterium]|jgi:hypothetical protein|nr:hypothetical protein [Acidobacteriaceae bacterium]
MRISCGGFFLGVGFLAMLATVPAMGQSDLPRFAGGVYGSVSAVFPLDPNVSAGAYVEAARFRVRPGIEVRATDQTVGEAGRGLMLAGPRIAHVIPGADVYAVGLFGPSHMMNSTGTKEISGVTSQIAVGAERSLGPFVRWRVMELNAGFFSGASGLKTFTISTGFVLHFH